MYGQNPYSQYPYTGYAYPNYGQRNYMQPQQQMAQAQPQVQQQPVQPTMPTLCYAKMEEAKPYIITAPNSSMLFIDREKGKALLKSTDNMCNSYPRYFNVIETDENGNVLQAQKQDQKSQMDFSQFAKKEELNGFATLAQYNELLDQLNGLKNIISGAKQRQTEIKPTTNDLGASKGNTQANK